jgi:secreted trypsin-like serine protease
LRDRRRLIKFVVFFAPFMMKLKEFLLIFVRISVMITAGASETTAKQLLKCGLRSAGSGDVVGGRHTRFNSWPWLVALRFKPTNAFFCGRSLISERHVVSGELVEEKIAIATSFSVFSAAHCVEDKHRREEEVKLPKDVVAWIGKHNLREDNEEGSVAHDVEEVIIHEDWKHYEDDFDADIALLVLKTEVDLA